MRSLPDNKRQQTKWLYFILQQEEKQEVIWLRKNSQIPMIKNSHCFGHLTFLVVSDLHSYVCLFYFLQCKTNQPVALLFS